MPLEFSQANTASLLGLPLIGLVQFVGTVVKIVNVQFQKPRLQTGAQIAIVTFHPA